MMKLTGSHFKHPAAHSSNRRCSLVTCWWVATACVASLLTGYFAAVYSDSLTAYWRHIDHAVRINQRLSHYHKSITAGAGTQASHSVCLNTCKMARDGVCNDGRPTPGKDLPPGAVRVVACDLGTDCDDCGPWNTTGHVPWVKEGTPGPIAGLLAKDIEVRVRRTSQPPFFDFAYTSPDKDVDVSHHMETGGVVEAGITHIFYSVFKEGCKRGGIKAEPGLLVDVGANFGWFSILAAAMGCRVLAFEPVPHFAAFLEYSAHLNGLAHLIDMRPVAVSHIRDTNITLVIPSKGVWGTAGIDGLNIDKSIRGSVNEELQVASQALDQLVQQDVLLLKVDVEGWEWSVMQGAAELFRKHTVQHVVMEYSPGVPERSFKYREIQATVQTLLNLADNGYRIAHLGDQGKHIAGNYDSSLPAYEEIKAHNLLYDLVDAALFSQDVMGCPIPPELQQWEMWSRCQAMPEDPSPRSLRSLLGHNTNIWATKQGTPGAGLQSLTGHVGILKLQEPYATWFVNATRPGLPHLLGMGSRTCAHLEPKVQVRHRCHCTKPEVCGAEEAAVQKLAAGPGMPSNYNLDEEGKLVQGTGSVLRLFKTIHTARDLGNAYLPGAVKGMLS